jgi:hypothetical protein
MNQSTICNGTINSKVKVLLLKKRKQHHVDRQIICERQWDLVNNNVSQCSPLATMSHHNIMDRKNVDLFTNVKICEPVLACHCH